MPQYEPLDLANLLPDLLKPRDAVEVGNLDLDAMLQRYDRIASHRGERPVPLARYAHLAGALPADENLVTDCPACTEGPPFLAFEGEYREPDGSWWREWRCMACEGHRRVHHERAPWIARGLKLQAAARAEGLNLRDLAERYGVTETVMLGTVLGAPPWWQARMIATYPDLAVTGIMLPEIGDDGS